ncbi:RNA polymerase sigma factor SigM [Phycicoccus duodecadis]|uniref:RNA polymerase sigma factor SigM n=1 Tax=Phycicoccus duodecadis TaxID=173053 RepID=UPI000C704379
MEDLGELDDAALVARHVEGDDGAAFGELFRRHRDRMYAVAIRTCGHREMAADAVQEAFVSAFRRAEGYRGEAAVTTWLHRIVVNACLDRLRRERTAAVRRAGDLAEIDLPDRHDHHASTETAIVVRNALGRLPEAQRAALVLVDMQGLSVAEAAAVLGVAEGTVKSRCFRGREALAAMLRPRPDTAGAGMEPPPPPPVPGRTEPQGAS